MALCLGLVACLLREDRLGSAFDGGGRWSIGVGGGRWNVRVVHKLCIDDCGGSLMPLSVLCRLQWLGDDVALRSFSAFLESFASALEVRISERYLLRDGFC